MNNLLRNCNFCGREYKVRSPYDMKTSKCCSLKCVHELQKKDKTLKTCEICKKEFFVLPSGMEKRFCSRKCKSIGHRKIKDPELRQCSVCKKIKNIELDFNKNGGGLHGYICKECGSARSKKKNRTVQGRFTFSKHLAKKREFEWSISMDEYEKLIKYSCHYCGYNLDETGIGLDRKDNFEGYHLNNVVPCCGLCNVTRSSNFTYEEMLLLAPTIKLILNKRKFDL